MGDIVNLRRARKAAVRRSKEAEASANRAAYGIPKTSREHAEALSALDRRTLDGHRRSVETDAPDKP